MFDVYALPLLRMGLYIIALLFSFLLVGQFLRNRHPFGRLLAATMGAWFLNALTLAALLYLVAMGKSLEPWRDLLTTINALLLAAVPVVIYEWFRRQGVSDA